MFYDECAVKLLCVSWAACSNGADVVFALDASDSTGFDHFQLMTQIVGMVVQTLDIDSITYRPTISRVGLVTFSDSAAQFNLNAYTTKEALLQAVNVPYQTGSNNLAQAIRLYGLHVRKQLRKLQFDCMMREIIPLKIFYLSLPDFNMLDCTVFCDTLMALVAPCHLFEIIIISVCTVACTCRLICNDSLTHPLTIPYSFMNLRLKKISVNLSTGRWKITASLSSLKLTVIYINS